MKILYSEHGIQIHQYSDLSGGFEICLPKGDKLWQLYEIPQYGGTPRASGLYEDLYEAITEAKSWT